jgi:hypothetical protein
MGLRPPKQSGHERLGLGVQNLNLFPYQFFQLLWLGLGTDGNWLKLASRLNEVQLSVLVTVICRCDRRRSSV